MSIAVEKYTGLLSGLALGDAWGARYEGGFLAQTVWSMIGRDAQRKVRYTDDTRMSLDIVESFLKNHQLDQDEIAAKFAASYDWKRGYGRGTARVLKQIRRGVPWQKANQAGFKQGSWGNGAAMRAPVLALIHPYQLEKLEPAVRRVSEITHSHPLAIEAAWLIALASQAALQDWDDESLLEMLNDAAESKVMRSKTAYCRKVLLENIELNKSNLHERLGMTSAATESSITALYFALKYRQEKYDAMLKHICDTGGDTDTVGAMAGALWGAFNGYDGLNSKRLKWLEDADAIYHAATSVYELAVWK